MRNAIWFKTCKTCYDIGATQPLEARGDATLATVIKSPDLTERVLWKPKARQLAALGRSIMTSGWLEPF